MEYTRFLQLLKQQLEKGPCDWDWENGWLRGQDEQGQTWSLKVPTCLPPVPILPARSRYDGPAKPAIDLKTWTESLPELPPPFLLILIQAGHSALGMFKDGEVGHHKVIKKYMVRGSGKSQVSYLATRGKSKAGSRIRLANTVRFFENINEKLLEWGNTATVPRILVSCPVRMQSLWFKADPPPPFPKEDERLAKVPFDVQRPDLEELLRVARLVSCAWSDTLR